ncbi:MAG: SDR family oxidoreductase [Caldilineaceae bacterium]
MSRNRVAVVTGSRRGIGRGIALALGAEGYDLVIHDYELDANAEQTAEEIRALGRQALLVKADLGESTAVHSLVEESVAHYGRIDVLVNNAATWAHEPFLEIQEKSWDLVVNVDLKAPYLLGQLAAKQMIAQPRIEGFGVGAMVNISSVHRVRVWQDDTVYGVVKAGIMRLTESMAYELGPHGIRVNAIAPGYIDSRVPDPNDTPIGQPSYAKPVIPVTPLRRIGVPQDIANAAAFLVSERASFITGQCLTVDGGFLLGGTPKGG